MKKGKLKYYDQEDHWGQDFLELPSEKQRIEETSSLIPKDVNSIFDAGCGNGVLLNYLKENGNYKNLVGLDFSLEGLKFVQTDKILSHIYEIPIKDNSFDLVICTEVVEHLNNQEFSKSIEELKRISIKYVLLTVPNNEDLETRLVICPQCKCHYSPFYHLQSFSKNNIDSIFTKQFKVKEVHEIGPYVYRYYNTYLKIRNLFKPQYAKNKSVCPQCEFQNNSYNPNKFIPSTNFLKNIEKFVFGEKIKKWLFILLSNE